MSDLTVKNFALFKDQTSFDFRPLTFLVGANGSGKSSVIKLLNLIEYNNRFHQADRFDLSNYEDQLSDPKKPFEIIFEVAKNLFCKKRATIVNDPQYSGIYYGEQSLSYFNEIGEEVLTTNPQRLDSSNGIKIQVDISRLYEILDSNELKEFKNKLVLSSIPQKILSWEIKVNTFWDEKNFENWLFNHALYQFFNHHSLDHLIIDQIEFTNVLVELFKPSFADQNKNQFAENFNRLNIDIIRLTDLGEPKNIFSTNDTFGQTLLKIHEFQPLIIEPQEFIDHWVKEFFGKDSKFEFRKIDTKYNFFEAKLNGKNMPEQGTGVFRILHLICKLSVFGGDNSFLLSLLKKTIIDKKNNHIPFIKKRFLVIEEPETNLHPNFQVLLAEMIFDLLSRLNSVDATNNLGKKRNFIPQLKYHIIIETHSEYMIRMIQYLVAKNEGTNNQVGIINFGTDQNAGKVKHISIQSNGALTDNFYSGFFNYSEDLRLMLDALNNQRNN